MSSPVCRLLPFAVADGPHNMAADEILLEDAAAGTASLRFYAWDVATVSLGYFQPARVRLEDPLLADLPFVRRPSGGATLVHHHEVTYCLALPPGPPWHDGWPWLRRMHGILSKALEQLGVAGALHVPCADDTKEGPLCFRHFAPGDLMIGAAKVVGSAQRKLRGALMQHGSILLARSPHTPSLPGILELSGQKLAPEELCQAVVEAFQAETGWRLEPAELSGPDRARIAERVGTKYGHPSWNEKR